jgi:ribosome-binding factor A
MRKQRHHHAGKTPPGQRQLRVAEHIRRVLSEILQRGHFMDADLVNTSLITVTSVEIGPDLKHATAYVMPLGGKDAERTVEALNRISGHLRTELAPQMDLRYTPKISFRLDTTFDEAEKIGRLLQQEKVRRDLEKDDEDEE